MSRTRRPVGPSTLQVTLSGLICRNGDDKMEATLPWNSKPQQTKLNQSVAGAESECERAIAEAETVLSELLLVEPRQSTLEPSSAANEKSRDPARRSVMPRSVPSAIDRLRLDPGLDFIVRDEGLIEMTEAGVYDP
jgi:hypothetical protein